MSAHRETNMAVINRVNLHVLPNLRELADDVARTGDLDDLQEEALTDAIAALEDLVGRLLLRTEAMAE